MALDTRLLVYRPSGEFAYEIAPADVFGLVMTEEINGAHSLEVTTPKIMTKSERVVFQDEVGRWREFVVTGEDVDHSSGRRAIGTYFCVWSVQYDLSLCTVDVMPGVQNPVTAAVALRAALSGTGRWKAGTVTNSATGGASMWFMSSWEALGVLVETWGGEIDATIEVGPSGVTGRKVDLYAKQGDQTPTRRFDYGADMIGIRRAVTEEPMACRIIPRGKGEETESGGYGRKITIESVNSGKNYLQNDATAQLYRVPNGSGGWEYPTLVVENGDIETPAELKAWGLAVLETYTTPQVTYTASVLQLARAGMDATGVALGDAVQCVDRKFSNDGLRLSGRVTCIVTNLLDETDIQLTVGNAMPTVSSSFASFDAVSTAVKNMNGGSLTTADYLASLLERLNGEINATGGYTYITRGHGMRTYDKAVTDPLVGSEADSVVEIKGGNIRIANSRTQSGDWNWKTVLVSGHIAANLVTAANITAGYIGSAGDTFIDLDNHTVQLGQSSSRHVVVDSDGLEIFNALTSIALFGVDSDTNPYVRIGSAGSEQGNVVIMTGSTSDSMSINLRRGIYTLMSMSYGLVHRYGVSSVWRGPYTTFGSRASDGSYYPGWASFVMGQECVARGPQSFSGGASCKALSPTAFTYGVGNEVDTGANSSDIGAALGRGLAVYGPMLACGTYNAYSSTINQYGRLLVGGGTSSSRSNAMVVYNNGDTVISGALTQSSDRRLKDHIEYLADDACEFVRALKPALFSMKSSGSRRLGFYAQDVQNAEPEGWGTDTVREEGMSEDMPDMLALDYTAIIAPLVAYAQALEERIRQLEEHNE